MVKINIKKNLKKKKKDETANFGRNIAIEISEPPHHHHSVAS